LIKHRYTLVATLICTLAIFSCKKPGGRFPKQGKIHYSVEYRGKVMQMPKELMPKSLVVSFKNDNILYELISPFGHSGITNLANPTKGIYDTYLSMFTIKYFYSSEPGESYPGFEAMDGIEINKKPETTVICGYKCKKAEVTLPSDRKKTYDIWYTHEIPVKNPNVSTPFRQIDGVLMSFFFVIGESEFHFVAENVYKADFPDKTFERKEKYVQVSREDISKFINKIVNL